MYRQSLNCALALLATHNAAEKFVRGSGSGGQAMQKSSNCVILTHKSSDIAVRCHATRSLEANRAIARRLMALRLDELEMGPRSYTALKS